MNYGIVLSSGNDVDFMIHGLFKYSFLAMKSGLQPHMSAF